MIYFLAMKVSVEANIGYFCEEHIIYNYEKHSCILFAARFCMSYGY